MGLTGSVPTPPTPCPSYRGPVNWENFQTKLRSLVFGQHIATVQLFACLVHHLEDKQPKKPLVMIWNGSLGTGKTYLAKIMVNGLCKKGSLDPSVKMFAVPAIFTDSKKTDEYKEFLKRTLEENAILYPDSIFIFDEVDKAPKGLFDVLSSYVDYYDAINKVDFRRCVFLFISNHGGDQIDNIVLQHYAENNRRESLTLNNFRSTLEDVVSKEHGGLQESRIIERKLIDHYVPFLPLEKRHIEDCLMSVYPKYSNISKRPLDLNAVADLFEYYPEQNPLFSCEGAKNLDVKLQYAIHDAQREVQIIVRRRDFDK